MKHQNKLKKIKLIPIIEALLIALSYLTVGCLWIFFSDQLMQQITSNPDTMALISSLKGWFYVLITAGLLLLLVYTRAKRVRKYQGHLEESEKRYRNLFYNSNAAQIIVDTETGSIHEANEAACEYYGYTPEDIKSKKIWDINIADPKAICERMRLTYEKGKHSFEGRHRLSDGEIRDVEVFSGRMDIDGQKMLYSIIHDITERKTLEQDLSRMNERFTLAARSANAGIWDWDVPNNVLVWDSQMYNLYGVRTGEFTGAYDAWCAKLHPDDLERCKAETNKALSGEKEYETEFRIIKTEGEVRYIKAFGDVLYDTEGKPLRMVGINFDITHQKHLEIALAQSMDNFKSLYDNMDEGVALHEMIYEDGKPVDYIIVGVNPKFEQMTRISRADAIGKTARQLYGTQQAPYLAEYSRVALSGESYSFETYYSPLNIYFHISVTPWGQNGFSTIFTDITERVLADEAIRSSEARLNRAQAMAHVGNWEIDLSERQIWASKEAFSIYGLAYESSYLPLQVAQDIVVKEDRPMMDRALQKLVENNERYDVEFRISRKNDGEIRTLHSLAELEYGDDGHPACVVGVIQDITYMKEAEKKLLASEARYRNLFQNNYAVQLILDSETADIVDANPAAGIYYGFALEELKKKKLWDINPSGKEYILEKLKNTYETGSSYLETKHIRADGKICDVEIFSGRLVLDGSKAIYAIVHDISERKQAERELIESEKRFRMLVENAPDAVFVQIDYRFAYVNKKTIEIFGAKTESDLIGKYIPDFLSEGFRSKVEETIKLINEAKQKLPAREEVIRRLAGENVDVEVSAIPIQYNKQDGALVFMRDITERKSMEKDKQVMEVQLRQKQKLESIGTLAGGVAHEINNPVNGIINYAQLIADDSNTDEQIKEYSSEIIREGQRVTGIVKDLLSFSRQEKQAHSPADIRNIIEQTVTLIRTVIRHDQIELEINIPEGLPSIKCRSQQIQQVLMNLLTNARDALNERYKDYNADKRIVINCSLFEREGRRWVKVTVEDSGTGIPEEIREKIFDPFFTTKPREIGTGLGLSISHGIVKDHHGELYFETKTGEYTRAVLELPVDNGWTL